MRHVIWLPLALMLASCATDRSIAARFDRLAAEYRVANGLTAQAAIPAETETQLREEATKQINAEVAADRAEAAKKGAAVAGDFAAGNIAGGIVGLLGLAMMGVRAIGKARGG